MLVEKVDARLMSHRPFVASGAGDGTRTHDILLGKQTLYQLSYTRMAASIVLRECAVQTYAGAVTPD